ncbi:protein lin-9 homolog isoform X1 [Ylistrum balloti]|uniref:protein lin-9 homolog isoform X1 n=1 Tax=Ylistrum balloti TaxID=509963 RepID=UPI002905E58B|nr:protein lin-9 homolog isoform X1 [Ylistrum balloti]
MADDTLEIGSSAEVLVSLKEGKGTSYRSPPRSRNPPRIRKKNQKFYNDDEDTSYSPSKSPRRTSRAPSSLRSRNTKILLSSSDKKSAQAIGVRLRNLLKLPKAHKWVCYEWFYSNLDIPLFLGENDFCICVKETFPQLKTKKIRRVEWNKIRRLMGKPRRCSPAFFAEERAALEQRRNKIRLLQQRKLSELNSFKDLPDEIPTHLVIGTKVTARLRRPQDGLFTGTVDALDTVNNSYRVTFDRPGLGVHSIPDYEVLSNEDIETIPLTAFQQKHRPRQAIFSPPRFVPSLGSPNPHLDNDPLLSGSPFKGRLMSLEGGTYGGFPIKFLVQVTKLSKILMIKKDWVKQLKTMNTEAEKMKSFLEPISPEFQRKYANAVLQLEDLNRELNECLIGVQQYCQEIAPEQGLTPLDQPSEIRTKCDDEAEEMVSRISGTMFHNRKKNPKVMDLIAGLTSLMLQVRTFSETELNSFEFKSLQDTLQDVKSRLDGNSLNAFKNNVDIHINHIQSGLSQMGNLHAFSATSFNV